MVGFQLPDSAVDLGVTSFPHAPCLPCHKSLGPNVTAWGVEDNGEDLAAQDACGLSKRVTRVLKEVKNEKEAVDKVNLSSLCISPLPRKSGEHTETYLETYIERVHRLVKKSQGRIQSALEPSSRL